MNSILATRQPARSVVVAGLATAEARWRQVRRRYMGKVIAFVDEPEATVLGVARLAECALGRRGAASQGETR